MRDLGWRDIRVDHAEIRAEVVSPLFRFRDDLTARIEGTNAGTLIHARSASRTGKGDLAANARHIGDLFAQVERSIRKP